jgi:polysaccharide export outer membrane protein
MKMKPFFAALQAFALAAALLLAPASLRAQDAELDRKILPSDGIVIEVFDEKLLSVERRVQAGGTISYPLLGTVEVAGKTTSEVADMITAMLAADYLVDPQVTVMVKEYRERTVSVTGKVNRPGAVILPAEQKLDVLDAIVRAGDFHPNANKNKIRVIRNGKTYNTGFDELKKQREKDKFWLEPGDVVEVAERFF